MDTPLWSDERIERECTAELGYTSGMSSIALMRKVRDFYEAELAKVRAERDERDEWQPVPRGTHYIEYADVGMMVSLDGSLLTVWALDDEAYNQMSIQLDPSEYRLCRRKAKQE